MVKHRFVPNLDLLIFQESFFNASVVITDGDLEKMCRRAGFTLVVPKMFVGAPWVQPYYRPSNVLVASIR